jgi:hypothetical protein
MWSAASRKDHESLPVVDDRYLDPTVIGQTVWTDSSNRGMETCDRLAAWFSCAIRPGRSPLVPPEQAVDISQSGDWAEYGV